MVKVIVGGKEALEVFGKVKEFLIGSSKDEIGRPNRHAAIYVGDRTYIAMDDFDTGEAGIISLPAPSRTTDLIIHLDIDKIDEILSFLKAGDDIEICFGDDDDDMWYKDGLPFFLIRKKNRDLDYLKIGYI